MRYGGRSRDFCPGLNGKHLQPSSLVVKRPVALADGFRVELRNVRAILTRPRLSVEPRLEVLASRCGRGRRRKARVAGVVIEASSDVISDVKIPALVRGLAELFADARRAPGVAQVAGEVHLRFRADVTRPARGFAAERTFAPDAAEITARAVDVLPHAPLGRGVLRPARVEIALPGCQVSPRVLRDLIRSRAEKANRRHGWFAAHAVGAQVAGVRVVLPARRVREHSASTHELSSAPPMPQQNELSMVNDANPSRKHAWAHSGIGV